jgi:general secretion pathway protein G
MNARNYRQMRRAGFTLTELLIVLAILVMLLALVVPRFLGARKKADRQAAQAQIELFRGALERFALDTKNFPTTEQGLEALLAPPADGGGGESASASGEDGAVRESTGSSVTGWDGPYVNRDSIGRDPWNHDYQYAYPPERGKSDFPDIWSFGPDGEDNTEDDICSWTVTAGDAGGSEPGKAKENLDIDVDVDVGKTRGGPSGRP